MRHEKIPPSDHCVWHPFSLHHPIDGTLVESIYILDLMNSNLDEKVLGLLFFFAPLLLLPFFRKGQNLLMWLLFALLFIARGLTPYSTQLGA